MIRCSRRRKRGAVMVEAIAVISFCTLAFLAVGYFRSLYVQKLYVQRLARASALHHAMGACKGDPQSSLGKDLGQRRFGEKSGSGVPFDAIPTPGSDKGSVALQRIREKNGDTGLDKVTSITLSGDAAGISKPRPDGPELGFRGDVSSTSFVVCGDPTPDDRYEGIVDQITSLF